MSTVRQTRSDAAAISKTYLSLLDHFANFCSFAKEIAEDRNNPLTGVEFVPNDDKRLFQATWAGRILEFRFAVVTDDAGTKGRITCVEIMVDEALKPEKVFFVTFNRHGVLDGSPPDDVEDEMEVGYPQAAWYLVTSAFLAVIRQSNVPPAPWQLIRNPT
jgi:hypothetical protein